MIITRLNSTNATLLIRLYKIFVRPYMDYGCTALTTLSKTQRHRLKWFSTVVSTMQKGQLILPVLPTMSFILFVIL